MKKKIDIPYYAYNIPHDSVTFVTRDSDPDDEWDADDTDTNWSISNSLIPTQDEGDVVTPVNVDNYSPYYLVYLTYSTGDSFSHDENKYIEFIDLFSTKQKADDLVNKIFAHNEQNTMDSMFSLTYENEMGEKRQLSTSWNGYFESINICEVKEVFLESNNKKQKSLLKNYL